LRFDAGRTGRNQGTLTLSNTTLDLNRNETGGSLPGFGSFVNATGGTVIATQNTFIESSNRGVGDTGVGAKFANQGVFRKTLAGTTTVFSPVEFNNTGSVEVQEGTLQLNGGGTSRPWTALATRAPNSATTSIDMPGWRTGSA
jgi:hypothetical protein